MRRALLSVSNKDGIVDFAKFLISKNIEIISTGGTASLLQENGISITPISDVTGNPEAFGGRMKSISFQIGSGLLYRRDNEQDILDAAKLKIRPIDIVCCNLYPFKEVSQKTKNLETLIENIDIGGPTMIRAAAKNYRFVSVLTTPGQYQEFQRNYKNIDEPIKFKWAKEAFLMTAEYDQYIINTLDADNLSIASTEKVELRYGENPHQKAWVIPWKNTKSDLTLQNAKKIQGKQISYNNMMDADAGWKCTSELNEIYPDKYITTIIKHANPCGVSISTSSVQSLKNAWECDPISSFGSIISTNKAVTAEFASWMDDKFVEIIMAPSFHDGALKILSKKKNLRVLELPNKQENSKEQVIKSINGGLLIQEEDEFHSYEFKNVTDKKIPDQFENIKHFGMIVNKYLKSNSIILVGLKDESMVIAGAGMGQPNRLDSLKMLAAPRALKLGFKMENTLLVSDAFFPFRDSIDIAKEVGIKYIIQPGGSIRDEEVIAACNEHGMAMDMTNIRHFRH